MGSRTSNRPRRTPAGGTTPLPLDGGEKNGRIPSESHTRRPHRARKRPRTWPWQDLSDMEHCVPFGPRNSSGSPPESTRKCNLIKPTSAHARPPSSRRRAAVLTARSAPTNPLFGDVEARAASAAAAQNKGPKRIVVRTPSRRCRKIFTKA